MDSLDSDIMQVMLRDAMDVHERRREEVLELMRKNRVRMRDVESKRGLTDFVVGDYVLVARVRQFGIESNLMDA